MPALSSLFLVIALVLSVVIGPQTRPWVWGPALVALGLAALTAVPVIWKRGKSVPDFGVILLGAVTAGWFGWRAWVSPVAELGQADVLLVATAVGGFVSVRAIADYPLAERILLWGVGLLLVANLVVIGQQIVDPTVVPLIRSRGTIVWPSGYFAAYNEAANYLIASAMCVGGAAVFGRHARATRVLWGIVALAGLAAVWFTRSRGGIFGAAVGCGVFAALALIMAKRRGSRAFAPALLAIPLIGLALGAWLIIGWQHAQDAHRAGSSIAQLFDNDCRLYFLGLALACIGMHPLTGGGSQSFSWECYQFWDAKAQGIGVARPDMVHNEWVQAATDYGLMGAGLIIGLLGTVAVVLMLRVLFEESPTPRDARDGWRLGAAAGLAGMLVQACFSFVFHMMAGVLLLGICLGQMSRSGARTSYRAALATRVLLTLAALAGAAVMMPAGWVGSHVTGALWPIYFGHDARPTTEARIDAFSEAIDHWPQSAFYQERATLIQQSINSHENPGGREAAERAILDYQQATKFNRFDPAIAVNHANLLSFLHRDTEAEEAFATAIDLQGGMEPGFHGQFHLALHWLHKGQRLCHRPDPQPALAAFQAAASAIELSAKHGDWWNMYAERVTIHEHLGMAFEATDHPDDALRAYNLASTLPTGTRAHYRAGALLGKLAVQEWWQRRPSDALEHFIQARQRLGQAGSELPHGVTLGQRAAYLAYLDRAIDFLTGAKVQPTK